MNLKKIPLSPDSYLPLRIQAYTVLKEAILSGTLAPGERLVEQQIADSLGLSRNPVREAFRRLEQEGYLLASRNGVIVQGVSLQELRDLYAVRVRLEGMAAALVAERATDEDIDCLSRMLDDMDLWVDERDEQKLTQGSLEFHRRMYSMLHNNFLSNILMMLTEQLHRYRSLQFQIPHRGRVSQEEDRLIVDAIARHDAAAADRYAQEHIRHLWEHAEAIVQKRIQDSSKESEQESIRNQ